MDMDMDMDSRKGRRLDMDKLEQVSGGMDACREENQGILCQDIYCENLDVACPRNDGGNPVSEPPAGLAPFFDCP